MNRLAFWLVAAPALFSITMAFSDVGGASEKGPNGNPAAASVNAFGLDLYGRLEPGDGNLFFSPYSLASALAMTYAGAKGSTASQMAKVLHFLADQDAVHSALGSLIPASDSGDPGQKTKLVAANAVWGQKGASFVPPYLELIKTHYGGGFQEVDFAASPEKARETINKWVEQRTEEKIKDLVPPGVIDTDTRMALTNAVYFKGTWANTFSKDQTRDAPFTLPGGNKVKVPMMSQTGDFRYLAGDGFQAIELPYEGNGLSMIVLLPDKPEGLPALERTMTADMLAQWIGKLQRRRVEIFLPKFKMTMAFRADTALKAMGMTEAFSQSHADFSGMTGKKDLFIGAVLHKAFVEVDEQGTEAAAATAVAMKLKSGAPTKAAVFRADHPFVCLIRHRPSNCILFLGRVAKP